MTLRRLRREVTGITPGSTVQIIAAAKGGIGSGSLTPPPAVKAGAAAVPAYTIPTNVTAQVDAEVR